MSVEVVDESGADVHIETLRSQAEFMLQELRIHPEAELSVLLVDETTMSEQHLRWMNEPGPTDVLSFPMDELRVPADQEEPEPGMLGDIVICPQVAEQQARTAGHTRTQELALLLTHGLLHLLGHDHAESAEHAEMFALQDRLLSSWDARGHDRGGPGA